MNRSEVTVEQENRDNEINLTPMLDVVFILLIFFVVTASFIKETGIDVNKPEASTRDYVESASILVAISENNEIWIEQRLIDPRALRANIERLRVENPESTVVIQADEHSQNKMLVLVMDAIRQAGIYDISIAANRD